MTPYSFRLEKSSGFAIPRAFQLAPASLLATTGVKSAAYSMGRWRFTESLAQSKAGEQLFQESRINRIGLPGASLAEATPAKDLRPEESLPSSCKNLNENG